MVHTCKKINMKYPLSITLQKLARGHLCRKRLRKPNDQMTFQLVSEMLEEHKSRFKATSRRNELLSKKKIRHANFPSEISENIVKFVFFHKYKIMPTWDTDTGDLQSIGINEVKAFSSIGPTSFGPTEKWDRIYFLDATQFNDSIFKVYECKLKNTSHKWQQLRVNKDQTFGEQTIQRRRPRLSFFDISQQLGTNCKLIFEGIFNEKLCDVNEPYNHTLYCDDNTTITKMEQITNSQKHQNTCMALNKKEELLRMNYRSVQKLASGIRKKYGKQGPKPVSQKKDDLLAFLYKYMDPKF